ncbi:hypothetical protein [Williamsia deligens]|uniref:Uncharacterized protein n=1 Tax=Williamsia deligens TaxID=321325 RepID=A0ABW3G6W2_9NOCA|nr:hypothetical protein [Williamsia deligens]MCP2193382.1 hypothetical protein [Williamsia deligens]
MTIALILIPLLILTVALMDRRSRRAQGLPTLDSHPGYITDLGPDADRIRAEVLSIQAHERPSTEPATGFPGPGWIGVR